MLNRFARALFTRIFRPIAGFLVRRGVSPDVVTLVGTLGVVVGALAFFPRGEFFWGTVFITAFVFSDLIDGTMARMTRAAPAAGAPGWTPRWTASVTPPSSAGLALWFAGDGDDMLLLALCLYCLSSGAVVSYAKARAEGLGMTANVGITERADRLVVILVATGLDGLGVPYVQALALWYVAVGSTVTIAQRDLAVRQQATAEPAP